MQILYWILGTYLVLATIFFIGNYIAEKYPTSKLGKWWDKNITHDIDNDQL